MTGDIWCVFSIDNNYDQPENNLVVWWKDKPSLDQLSRAVCGLGFVDLSHEDILQTVDMWKGARIQYRDGDTEYRLELISEGVNLV